MPGLPATYARLVAEAPSSSFGAAARVDAATPMPRPGPGEVLVRIHWAGVNGGCETFRARGEQGTPFARHQQAREPYPLGAEGSGVVVARGPGVGPLLPLGQAVAVNTAAAFAEYALAKAASCTPVREATAAATAVTLSALTAAAALGPQQGGGGGGGGAACTGARVTPGCAVVVTTAAGGAGHFALQYARLYGAGKVVAVVGSERKARWLRDEFWPLVLKGGEGAAAAAAAAAPAQQQQQGEAGPGQVSAVQTDELVVVDYSEYLPRGGGGGTEGEAALAAALRAACGDGRAGADVVFEGVGGAVGRACVQALAPGGVSLQVGYISEYPHTTTAEGGAGKEEGGKNGAADAAKATTAATAGAQDGGGAAAAAAASITGTTARPPNAELFWKGLDVDLGEGRRVTGAVWPRDAVAIGAAKRRVFDDFNCGLLVAATHAAPGLRGVAAAPEAVALMLRGEHVGKFVVPIL